MYPIPPFSHNEHSPLSTGHFDVQIWVFPQGVTANWIEVRASLNT